MDYYLFTASQSDWIKFQIPIQPPKKRGMKEKTKRLSTEKKKYYYNIKKEEKGARDSRFYGI